MVDCLSSHTHEPYYVAQPTTPYVALRDTTPFCVVRLVFWCEALHNFHWLYDVTQVIVCIAVFRLVFPGKHAHCESNRPEDTLGQYYKSENYYVGTSRTLEAPSNHSVANQAHRNKPLQIGNSRFGAFLVSRY